MLLESKSLLAKLMATENLHIEQRKVETAMFNTETRVLTVPILDKNVPAYTYDLFMGHEVGHALYTPHEEWVKVLKREKINKSIVNVVEDSRIERKIKFKYPGIRSSFVKAYNDLYTQDFFATNEKNLDELNFIDRINLHQKVGAGLNIKFTEEERELLTSVETTEKFKDVIEVSKRLQEFIKLQVEKEVELEQKKQKVKVKVKFGEPEEGDNQIPAGIDLDADTDFEIEFEGEPESSDKEKNGEPKEEPINSEQESGKSEEGPGEAPKGKSAKEDKKQSFEEALKEAVESALRSFTDEAYKEKEKTLFDAGKGRYTYVNVPKFDTQKSIYDYKPLYLRHKVEKLPANLSEFGRIRNESNKVVSYLVKEFELRKNADETKRATVAKTGDLNMNKLFAYKFTDDIFKKITVMPGGKSHGLVMFLDWSGSMAGHIENTVKQLINLVLFCKKVSIPYEVYAFSDDGDNDHTGKQLNPKQGDMCLGSLTLLNVLSSRMSASDFTYACSALISMAQGRCPSWMRMHSTPLNEAVIAAMDIVPAFQKKYRLQVVNTVFLTDGDGNCQRAIFGPKPYDYYGTETISVNNGDFIIFRDPVSKHEIKVGMNGRNYNTVFTSALISLLKLKTRSNIVGFYVIAGREFANVAEKWYKKEEVEKVKESFKKERYAVLTDSGFDEYYFLRSNGLNTDDEGWEVNPTATQRQLVSAFTKYAANKIENRVVLNRFIGMIA